MDCLLRNQKVTYRNLYKIWAFLQYLLKNIRNYGTENSWNELVESNTTLLKCPAFQNIPTNFKKRCCVMQCTYWEILLNFQTLCGIEIKLTKRLFNENWKWLNSLNGRFLVTNIFQNVSDRNILLNNFANCFFRQNV